MKEVPKCVRDVIVPDESDEYDSDELEQRENMMWGDVQSVGYGFAFGRSSLRCKTKKLQACFLTFLGTSTEMVAR